MNLKFSFLFVLIVLLFLAGCSGSTKQGQYDAFAQCISEKGAVMYGTEWCSHCKNQKEMFGSSFKYVTYVDCDYDMGACSQAGVKGYPTLVIDGESYAGEQSLSRLAYLTKCEVS